MIINYNRYDINVKDFIFDLCNLNIKMGDIRLSSLVDSSCESSAILFT